MQPRGVINGSGIAHANAAKRNINAAIPQQTATLDHKHIGTAHSTSQFVGNTYDPTLPWRTRPRASARNAAPVTQKVSPHPRGDAL